MNRYKMHIPRKRIKWENEKEVFAIGTRVKYVTNWWPDYEGKLGKIIGIVDEPGDVSDGWLWVLWDGEEKPRGIAPTHFGKNIKVYDGC